MRRENVRGARALLFALPPLFAALLSARTARGVPVAPPRPISDAEREAVRLAADYLDRGPAAFQEALAASSPLRTLPAAEARDEIEVRAGGRADVRWELRTPGAGVGPDVAVFSIEAPSGLDDTLLVRMVRERDSWRVLWLRSFHEPWHDGRAAAASVASPATPAAPSEVKLAAVAAVGGVVAALLILAGVSFLPDKPLVAAVWGAAGVGAVALTALTLSGRIPLRGLSRRAPELLARVRRGSDVDRLARLLPLRRRLEAGEPRDTGSCLALAAKYPEPAAQLWIAQRLLATGALSDARRIASHVKSDPPAPWTAVVRARIAFLEKRETDAAAAYETAAAQGAPHDGNLLEALEVARILGEGRLDAGEEVRLAGFGARSADARVVLASAFARDEKPGDAEAALLSAWRERPLDREELLGEDDLQEVLHRPAVLKLLELAESEQSPAPSEETGRRAVAFPASAQARVCGRALRVTLGESQLRVPAGAELAPAGTPAEDPGAERRVLVARALSELPALLADPPQVGAFVQPVLRRRTMTTCLVLARRSRWKELEAATARLGAKDEQVPAELLMLRAQALRRLGRPAEARQLLVELGASAAFVKRGDPFELYEMGELFDGLEEYDRAIRCLEAASSKLRREALTERLAQVRTEKALAARFATSSSPHFDVRFPPERRDGFGEEATRVLEAERRRLAKWLPAGDAARTTVQILWLQEFRRTYGASGDVLGIYDGKIRVPLAGVWRFGPFAVSIVTHELAHALIAAVTNDNAPRWFHEGLAQHLEMRPSRPNDVVQYRKDGSLLSLPVVETVLERMPDAYFVEQAYQESEWAVAYLDARYGTAGLSRLMAAWRDGLSGDEALSRALGTDMARLSKEFVEWSLKQPLVLHDEIVKYDEAPDEGFHWSRDPKAPLGTHRPDDIPDSLTN